MNPPNDHEDGGEFAPHPSAPVLTLTKREAMIAGFMQAWACDLAARGMDPRKAEAPAMVDQVTKALQHQPHPPAPRDMPLIIAAIGGAVGGFLLAFYVFLGWFVAPYAR